MPHELAILATQWSEADMKVCCTILKNELHGESPSNSQIGADAATALQVINKITTHEALFFKTAN